MAESESRKQIQEKLRKTERKSPFDTIRYSNNTRWLLAFYDLIFYCLAVFLLLGLHPSDDEAMAFGLLAGYFFIGLICIFGMRFLFGVYRQIWRYGGMQAYILLILADTAGSVLYLLLTRVLPIEKILAIRLLSLTSINLLLAISSRMFYYYVYQFGSKTTKEGAVLRRTLQIVGQVTVKPDEPVLEDVNRRKIKVAIIGAGRVGVGLAEELLNNPMATYLPVCFVDISKEKIGRQIYGLPVLAEMDVSADTLHALYVQEAIFAIPQMRAERKKTIYDLYRKLGLKVKVYDYPVMQTAGSGRRALREFDIEELLFRPEITFNDESTGAYYRDKVVLITGGGGSIGSELCRQIAKMQPKRLIVLDICENGAYDVQQELKIAYGNALDLSVEILSVTDRRAMDKVFRTYHPQIVLHAAAHKHVPLMEHNCCEAVKNNVFGTLYTVQLCEKYKVQRFILVSTDKAVNPTNVMGATKRMCEIIVQSYSAMGGNTVYSATRFGNVLGSAGSVIPLFRRQIANGGPVTLTDRRIIRYFMTIPEASQLVLESGSMAQNGELFVLDMGKPVKILELAENMIRLSGLEPYRDIDIVETGLRPGEKLYEELLIRDETLTKTENSLIFIEKDSPIGKEELFSRLQLLAEAVGEEDDMAVRKALRQTVPTFRSPEEVNAKAHVSQEMLNAREENEIKA